MRFAPLALTLCACAALPAAKSVDPALPFIEDDFPAALALAKSRSVPLFVDAWAPW
jgi:hypothetical protein